jgi:predicted transcriptional regulator
MATLTVEIDKERDLPVIQALLDGMGLEFNLEEDEDDDWGDLHDAAIEGIKAGLANSKAGRTLPHADVTAMIDEMFNRYRANK